MKKKMTDVLRFIKNEKNKSIYNTVKDLYKTDEGTDYRNNVNTLIPEDIKKILNNSDIFDIKEYIFDGSVGKGMIGAVPHNAIMDKKITTSTQHGVYLVYLYSSDGSKIYLSLNQGVTNIRNLAREHSKMSGDELIQYYSKHYRNELNKVGINTAKYLFDIDLSSSKDLPRGYEIANILAKEYDVNSMSNLEADLIDLLKIYSIFVEEELYQSTNNSMILNIQKDFEDNLTDEFRVGLRPSQKKYSHTERSIIGIQEAKDAKGLRAENKAIKVFQNIFGSRNVIDKSKVSVGYDIQIINGRKSRGIEVKNISGKKTSCFYLSENEAHKLLDNTSRLLLVDNNNFYLSRKIEDTKHLSEIISHFKNDYLYCPDKWKNSPYTLESENVKICFHSTAFYEDFVSFMSLGKDGKLTKEFLLKYLKIV